MRMGDVTKKGSLEEFLGGISKVPCPEKKQDEMVEDAAESEDDDSLDDLDWDSSAEVAEPHSQPALETVEPHAQPVAIPTASTQSVSCDTPPATLTSSTNHKAISKEEVISKPVQDQEAKSRTKEQRRIAREQRQRAVELHKLLALCSIARLRALNHVCDNLLLQALILSATPADDTGKDCNFVEQVASFLAKSAERRGQCSIEACLTACLKVFTQDQPIADGCLALVLVARCRAAGIPARLTMALPLPSARTICRTTQLWNSAEGFVPVTVERLWVEIFDATRQSWNVCRLPGFHALAPPELPCDRVWILAANEGSTVRDVTQRYWERGTTLRELRGSLACGWEAIIAPWLASDATPIPQALPKETEQTLTSAEADRLDVQKLTKQAAREPLPSSKSAYKRHPRCVLESLLGAKEAVYPPDTKSIGLFRGQDPIWCRDNVKSLMPRSRWQSLGLQVRADEAPYKTLKTGFAEAIPLFGEWQTEPDPQAASRSPLQQVEEFTYGPIPGTNRYGTIDFFSKDSKAPPGTVFLNEAGALSAAKRLGVPFAPAATGFKRERGQNKPEIGGVIVWLRHKEEVSAAAVEENKRMEEQRAKEFEQRMETIWKTLIKRILVDQYVESRHGGR
eukprot:gnl/MRDRNA2_/MRDRNA2_71087_c0_seq1.p1 gnl/MRDRNA2_/MRDRNA2_71087_c0~~gnl/MRDRNA2_/MRDRNA2_71087_c0_seq1.p1  ORF type:complete len:625 (+),score=119.24 gnl/MRDRNA2_/MRDRNA2_71087_c0_seq1:205-2079(+)